MTATRENSTERDPRPIVARPRPGLPGAAIALIALATAILLFLVLDARRRHPAQVKHPDASALNAFPSPPPLVLPPEPAMTPLPPQPAPMVPVITQAPRIIRVPEQRTFPATPMVLIPPVAQPPVQPVAATPTSRFAEPALVLDNGQAVAAGPERPAGSTTPAGQAAGGGAADDTPARTTVIGNKTTIMPTGTIIPAVLETPIDSARPGLVRAVVAENARGFDGKRVLVPRGSRLIGEYQSDVRSGQNRVLVTWTRLIRPDGVAIRIGSPAADALGGAGVPGRVNNFFFQRFASAVLQSALAVGVNLASRPGNGSVIVGFPTSSAGSIGQNLLPSSDLKPKITVKQGALVNVFVARDLDFAGAPQLARDDAR